MRVVVAPDSFKGSMTSPEAARAMALGVADAGDHDVLEVPLADGGEGTLDALLRAAGGTRETVRVRGPLGEERAAELGYLPDGTAVVEMARASGLELIPPHRRDPLVTTTCGTGELILHAIRRGARRVLVALGGSGTVDGGAGAATALGFRLLDARGEDIPPGGRGLLALSEIDDSGVPPAVREVEVLVACDVDNPLLGERGAARVFGPQKGASPEALRLLEEGLGRLAELLRRYAGRDVADLPGAGAAGGLGAGLAGLLGARLLPGIELILDAVDFDRLLVGADLLLTGEGRIDAQTLYGKAPYGAARRARGRGIPVIGLAGSLGPGAEGCIGPHCFDSVFSIVPGPVTEEEAVARGREFLRQASRRVVAAFMAGRDRGEH